MKQKIALLYGGNSFEREVSLKSAKEVHKALEANNYRVEKILVDKDLVKKLQKTKADVAFIAMHGGSGEDGTVQSILEALQIPYTGSGVRASALAMNKTLSKRLFIEKGINTAPFLTVRFGAEADLARRIKNMMGFPVVVKAPSQGSTIGLCVVDNEKQLAPALDECFKLEQELLVEKFIKGVEITVGIIGNKKLTILPTLEVTTKTGFYDYKTKYTQGLSGHIIPARISAKQEKQAIEAAIKAHEALGCRGFSRIDFIVPKGKEPLILEANTIPGLTKLSLFPDMAKAAGIEFNDLINQFVQMASV